MNQHVGGVPVIFLTYQCQVWQFSQTLAFVQYSLPLVVDRIRTIAGLAAQLDITALQQFAIHHANRLGGFDCKNIQISEILNAYVKHNTTTSNLLFYKSLIHIYLALEIHCMSYVYFLMIKLAEIFYLD